MFTTFVRRKLPQMLTQARSASTFEHVGLDYDIEDCELERTPQELMVKQPWTTLPF